MTNELQTLLSDYQAENWAECPRSLPAGDAPHVYVLKVRRDGAEFVLYVGQTGNLRRRFGDYQYKSWHAPTDFRVGEAGAYLLGPQACAIDFLFKSSDSPLQDERLLIRELLLHGEHLLNCLAAFDYKTAAQEEERKIIHRFCDMALRQASQKPC